MSIDEKILIAYYRLIPTLKRIAINAYLQKGDARLLLILIPGALSGDSHQTTQITPPVGR